MILRKYHILYILMTFFASLHGMKTHAQQQTLVDVNIDVADIMIGEQTMLHLSVTADKDKQLVIPLPGEMLTEGVEVLHITPPDTTDIKNNRMTINYDLLITSFDSSLYLLPPFYVIDGRDTLYSDQVALKVSSPDVDLEHPEEFKDIKDIWRPPFVLSDYYALIYGILFTLFLICVVGYFIQRMRNRPEQVADVKEAPKLPPHEQAMMELKEIRERKLWQQGRNKEYYTEVTDTLRRYMSARYGTSVMEKTSSEILEVLRNEEPGNKDVYDLLKQILRLSDFVKFAKLHPLPDENDLSMFNANLFVDRTKREEMPVAPPPDDNRTGDDRKRNDEPTNN
ncbi:MAG: hypothetical protein LBH77_06410 [Tannerella sp.]|jgi:hypothetical protein|nr:hypothetical protein [Tannerella sp.]